MGMGSNTTPPWVDEEIIDREKRKKKDLDVISQLKNLQSDNEELKKRIKELEDDLSHSKKITYFNFYNFFNLF